MVSITVKLVFRRVYVNSLLYIMLILPGKMFPTRGDLHIVPFTDDTLYMEQFSKANFW